jgi:hypothetical protein
MAIDAGSGATLEHFPNPVTVVLQPVRIVRTSANTTIVAAEAAYRN